MKMVNKIYLDKHFNLINAYENGIEEYYDGNFEILNFCDSEKSASDINKFVADFTKNEIRNLADPQMFDNVTAMVLVNAVLFENKWSKPFKAQSWKTDFYSVQNSTTQVIF
uniref:Serpin domain-containing protein n=1 Tax=Panagrolaimus sp. ES5 TaxID=591445 RepID=A0AC34F121_9BILA